MPTEELIMSAWENTELCEYTPEDADQTMQTLRSWGYDIQEDLTPEEFARKYNELNARFA